MNIEHFGTAKSLKPFFFLPESRDVICHRTENMGGGNRGNAHPLPVHTTNQNDQYYVYLLVTFNFQVIVEADSL